MATAGKGYRADTPMSNGTRTFVTTMLHYGQKPNDYVVSRHIREHKHTNSGAPL